MNPQAMCSLNTARQWIDRLRLDSPQKMGPNLFFRPLVALVV